MHSIWNFFLEKRAFTVFTMIALILAGLVATLAIPKESSPEVKVPVGIVVTALPGASAADVERLVTNKIEDNIKNVANIDKVTSSSQSGVSVITANFIASADIDKSIQDLRTAVDRSKGDLPSEAKEPSVTEVNFADQPIFIVGVSTDIAPVALTDLGKSVKDDLERIPGVSNVDVVGTRDHESSIILDKDALARNNLRVEQVIGALAGANAALPSGDITVGEVSYPVQFQGDIKTPSELPDININTPTGVVALRDIATVIDGYAKPVTISRLSADTPKDHGVTANSLTLMVHKKSGGNVVALTKTLRNRIDELKKTTLAGSNVVVTFDRGELVAKDLRELSRTGAETVALVMIVLMITIGTREALIAALSVPLSFVIAFIALWATGNTINFISLFSLILAIGILVDTGIVVVEAIHTRRERGMETDQAAKEAIEEYAWPLIAGTMVTIAVFVPLFFLSGVTGKFVSSIPFTLIGVLLASIFVALGNVPLLTIFLTSSKHAPSKIHAYRELLWHKIDLWYRAFLGAILINRKYWRTFLVTLYTFFVIALSLPALGLVKSVFFPSGDTDFIYVNVELPQASTLSQSDKVAAEVEKIIAQNRYVTSFVTTIGETSSFDNSGSKVNEKFASITVNLTKERKKDATDSSDAIASDLRNKVAAIADGKISVMTPSNGPPSGAPIVVKIQGDNLNDLAVATDKLTRVLETIPGTRDVASSLSNDGTEIDLSIDREKASQYGLTASNVATTLRAAVSGIKATQIRMNGTDIDVRVTMNLNSSFVNPEDTTKTDVNAIRDIPLATPKGIINVGSLLSASAGRNTAAITHEQSKRQMTVSAYIAQGANAIEATNAFRKAAEKVDLPKNVSVNFGGDDEEIKRTQSEMGIALVSGLVLMFSIVLLAFNAVRATLRLIVIVPLSIAGVMVGLALMGQPLSFTSMLGMIALGGVIINHGILLTDTMTRMKKRADQNPDHIVLDAAAERLRPIVLTTITTVIGMIPLTMVNAMWAPLAWGIAFGLTFATVLTLIFIPLQTYRELTRTSWDNYLINIIFVIETSIIAAEFAYLGNAKGIPGLIIGSLALRALLFIGQMIYEWVVNGNKKPA